MPATRHALPDGWTIRITPTMNILTLTLADDSGNDREYGFHTTQATAPETVHALEEITDPELRAAAQRLIDTYFGRLAQVRKKADEFNAAFPDWPHLTTRLRAAVPHCRIETDLDSDALALRMTLTATGPVAGQLLTLLATWRTENSPSGVTCELDDDGTLAAVLTQTSATDFLGWFRSQN